MNEEGKAARGERFFGALADFTSRRAARVVLAAAVLTAAAWLAIPSLKMDPDVAALFPEDSPLARDFRIYREAFPARDSLFLVVESSRAETDAERLMDAADLLTEKLERSELFRSARCALGEEEESFYRNWVLEHALWLVPPERWDAARERLDPARIPETVARRRAEMFSPDGASLTRFMDADPLGLAEFLPFAARDASEGMEVSLRGGYFFSPDGKRILIVAMPEGDSLRSESARGITEAVLRAQEEVAREVGGVAFRNTGGAFFAAEDESSIRGDVVRTAAWSLPGVLALLLLVFGGAGIFVLSVPTVVAALSVAAGMAAMYPGRFTILTAGFAAVMAGLGVDYIIHFYNAFRAALPKGSVVEAVRRALLDAGPGVAGGAATTALAFAALMGSGEAAVAELGFLLAAGTLAFLLSALIFMPALALVLARAWPGLFASEARPTILWNVLSRGLRAVVEAAVRRPRATLALAAILTVALGWRVMDMRMDDDLRALRSARSEAAENERWLSETFGGGGERHVFFTEGATANKALERITSAADIFRARLGDAGALVDAPGLWVPPPSRLSERAEQMAALPLEGIRRALHDALEREGFDPAAFHSPLLRGEKALDAPLSVETFMKTAPPGMAERYFAEHEGTFYAALTVFLPQGSGAAPISSAFEEESKAFSGNVHAASLTLLVRDFRERVTRETGVGLIFVGVAVLLAVWWMVRSWRYTLAAFLPVACGVVWALGAMNLAGTSLNLVSAAFLPMLMGIGIDDGLHVVFHRLRRPGEDVAASVLLPGRGILLTSLTTILGFAALLTAHSRGLAGIGVLGVAGMAACLFASVVVLPATLALMGAPSWSLKRFLLGGVFWRKFHRWAVRNIGVLEAPIVGIFSFLFFLALPSVRRAVDANLSRVLGKAGWLERKHRVFRAMHNFAKCATDAVRLMETGRDVACDVEGQEHFDACRDAGKKGVVFLSAHMGSWECASRVLLDNTAMSVHVVRAREADAATQAYEKEHRHATEDGRTVVHYVDRPDYFGFGLLRALKEGDAVTLHGDRAWPGGRAVEKTFFGAPAMFPVGPAMLAALAGVPILPVFAYRTGTRRHRLVMESPIYVRSRDEADISRAMDEIIGALERAVRRDPFQWCCFVRFWKK